MTARPDAVPALPDPHDVPTLETVPERPASVWRIAMRRFFRRKLGVTGLVLVGFMVLVAVLAPLIAPYPYEL